MESIIILILTMVTVFIVSIILYQRNNEWYSLLSKPGWMVDYGAMILFWILYMVGKIFVTLDIKKDKITNMSLYLASILYLTTKIMLFYFHDINMAMISQILVILVACFQALQNYKYNQYSCAISIVLVFILSYSYIELEWIAANNESKNFNYIF